MKVLDIFPIGDMLSLTLSGACETLKNGSRLIDQDGNTIIVASVAMTRHEPPGADSTTILVDRCGIEKGAELFIA